jgi:hypothetical protein
MVAHDRVPFDPAIPRHVVHWCSLAEPPGTRHSRQTNEDMHQVDLHHGMRALPEKGLPMTNVFSALRTMDDDIYNHW